tara:strand:+ start:933 stop:1253 length:321 start_codon:yes stop_codon:yes gene_type:complete
MRQWKYTVKDYQKLALEGYTLAETAKELGVSSQAVYDTAKRHQLVFARKDKRGGFRLRTDPETFDGTISGERKRRSPEKMGDIGWAGYNHEVCPTCHQRVKKREEN